MSSSLNSKWLSQDSSTEVARPLVFVEDRRLKLNENLNLGTETFRKSLWEMTLEESNAIDEIYARRVPISLSIERLDGERVFTTRLQTLGDGARTTGKYIHTLLTHNIEDTSVVLVLHMAGRRPKPPHQRKVRRSKSSPPRQSKVRVSESSKKVTKEKVTEKTTAIAAEISPRTARPEAPSPQRVRGPVSEEPDFDKKSINMKLKKEQVVFLAPAVTIKSIVDAVKSVLGDQSPVVKTTYDPDGPSNTVKSVDKKTVNLPSGVVTTRQPQKLTWKDTCFPGSSYILPGTNKSIDPIEDG